MRVARLLQPFIVLASDLDLESQVPLGHVRSHVERLHHREYVAISQLSCLSHRVPRIRRTPEAKLHGQFTRALRRSRRDRKVHLRRRGGFKLVEVVQI